jgi:hypothetical protein
MPARPIDSALDMVDGHRDFLVMSTEGKFVDTDVVQILAAVQRTESGEHTDDNPTRGFQATRMVVEMVV